MIPQEIPAPAGARGLSIDRIPAEPDFGSSRPARGHRADQLHLSRALHALSQPPADPRLRRAQAGRIGDARWTSPRAWALHAGRAIAGQPGPGVTAICSASTARLGQRQIIDEWTRFAGAGWNFIKRIWGSDWDGLFARDTGGALGAPFAETVDWHADLAAKTGATTASTSSAGTRCSPRCAGYDARSARPPHARRPRPGMTTTPTRPPRPSRAADRILAHTNKGAAWCGRQGKMNPHSQKKPRMATSSNPNASSCDHRLAVTGLAFSVPADSARALPEEPPRAARRRSARLGRPAGCASAGNRPLRGFRAQSGGKEMSTTMALCAYGAASRTRSRLAPRTHRLGRGPHLRPSNPSRSASTAAWASATRPRTLARC